MPPSILNTSVNITTKHERVTYNLQGWASPYQSMDIEAYQLGTPFHLMLVRS